MIRWIERHKVLKRKNDQVERKANSWKRKNDQLERKVESAGKKE